MIPTLEEQRTRLEEATRKMLHSLQFSVHLIGYSSLVVLIPCYRLDNTQGLSKELYPFVAAHCGYPSGQAVEHGVRVAILDAWDRRDPEAWEEYFPGMKKPPTNKHFIATLAERLKS